jgi:hypothetical protein
LDVLNVLTDLTLSAYRSHLHGGFFFVFFSVQVRRISMTKITYELRSAITNKMLASFQENDLYKAHDLTMSRNGNPCQTPVKLMKVITEVTEVEMQVAA